MLLSRFWYVVLSIAVGVSLYIVFLAVGQFNRRQGVVMKEGLASDSQTVEWALKIDSRRRLDQLSYGSLNPVVQKSLVDSNGAKDNKVPSKAREETTKALKSVMEQIPAEFKPDAIFAVDRDGRVVGQSGFDQVASNEDFELGGYPVVFDALHGFLRDDTWVLGDKLYLVCARPVETEAGSAPAGAIVGIKEFSRGYATDLAKRTRTNLAFYAAEKRVASATGTEGFEESQLELIGTDISKLGDDKTYESGGRSDVRMLRADDLGVMYARLPGDAWDLHAGFAVIRPKVTITSPMGFISGADDKDKSSVPYLIIVPVLLLAALIGIALSLLEHTLPLREMVGQAERLKIGQIDGLQVARFRGAYRGIAQNVNGGIERIVEKGGGVPRRPADLESILGPVPAQPAMSAFAFPMDGQAPPPAPSGPALGPGGHSHGSAPQAPPSVPGRAPPTPPAMNANATQQGMPQMQRPTPPVAMNVASQPAAFPPPGPAAPARPGPPPVPGRAAPPPVPPPRPAPPPPRAPEPPGDEADDDEATMVAAIPAEVLAQATGERPADVEAGEWLKVYEDFIRTKKQCGEATDGLTFEKVQHTLKKNRDALMQRHGCKRVRFSVYVKEGRASLKATPVKE
jgi:hypothetical protein